MPPPFFRIPNRSDVLLTPDDWREILAYIAPHRSADTPFDAAQGGQTEGTNRSHDAKVVAAYADAGVTWWVEGLSPWRFGWHVCALDHLYVCALDSVEYRRHLLFRDYLRAHPDTPMAYAALKRQLAEQYRGQRDAYTDAKGPFVRAAMARAEEWARMTAWAVPERQT